MKRVILLAVAALFVLSTVCTAPAAELNVRGGMDVFGEWLTGGNPDDVNTPDNFSARQRMRTYFDFMANENLKMVLGLEINNYWGQDGQADFTTDGTSNIKVKHAYLDFTEPNSGVNIKAGLQTVSLPGVFGNPIMDDDAAGLLISKQINDMVAVTLGWVRGYDGTTGAEDTDNDYDQDDLDIALIAVPVTADGISVVPYFAYAWIGGNVDNAMVDTTETYIVDAVGDARGLATTGYTKWDDDMSAWWLGSNVKVDMLDPIVIMADLMYGSVDGDEDNNDRAGYVFDMAVDYKMDMMTPEFFFMYGSGEDDDKTDGSELMPYAACGNWGASVGVGAGSIFWNGSDTLITNAPVGLWAVGFALKDITFVEKLSNTVKVLYAQGTNDEDFYDKTPIDDTVGGLSENDSLVEVDVITKYQIFEELAAAMELSYINPDLEEDDHGKDSDIDNIWKIAAGLQYRF